MTHCGEADKGLGRFIDKRTYIDEGHEIGTLQIDPAAQKIAKVAIVVRIWVQ